MLTGDPLYEISYDKIMELLPHRPPFLFIDYVKVFGNGTGIGVKNVTCGEYYFSGHFPNNPVMPGVLLIEAMAQTSGALMLDTKRNLLGRNFFVYFLSIDNARFKKPVYPGNVVEMHAHPKRSHGWVWQYAMEAYVSNTLVATVNCTAAAIKDNRILSMVKSKESTLNNRW